MPLSSGRRSVYVEPVPITSRSRSGSTGSRAPARAPTRCRCCTSRYRRAQGAAGELHERCRQQPRCRRQRERRPHRRRHAVRRRRHRAADRAPGMRGGGQRQRRAGARGNAVDRPLAPHGRALRRPCVALAAHDVPNRCVPVPRAAGSASAAGVVREAQQLRTAAAHESTKIPTDRVASTSGCVPVETAPRAVRAVTAASPVEDEPGSMRAARQAVAQAGGDRQCIGPDVDGAQPA